MAEKIRIAVVSKRGRFGFDKNRTIRKVMLNLLKERKIDRHFEITGLRDTKLDDKLLGTYHHIIVYSSESKNRAQANLPPDSVARILRIPEVQRITIAPQKFPQLEKLADNLNKALKRDINILAVCRLGEERSRRTAEAVAKAVKDAGFPNSVNVVYKGIEGRNDRLLELRHILDADHIVLCEEGIESDIGDLTKQENIRLERLPTKVYAWPSNDIFRKATLEKKAEEIAGQVKKHLDSVWTFRDDEWDAKPPEKPKPLQTKQVIPKPEDKPSLLPAEKIRVALICTNGLHRSEKVVSPHLLRILEELKIEKKVELTCMGAHGYGSKRLPESLKDYHFAILCDGNIGDDIKMLESPEIATHVLPMDSAEVYNRRLREIANEIEAATKKLHRQKR